jgi:hypothetical protein
MLELLAAFVFIINQDPMTDALTYEASVGTDRAGISIYCGAASNWRMAVEFRSPSSLYEYGGSKASVEWRFDDGVPMKKYTDWDLRRTRFADRDAEAFAKSLSEAKRITVRLSAAYGDDVVLSTPVSDPDGAIGKVLSHCSVR